MNAYILAVSTLSSSLLNAIRRHSECFGWKLYRIHPKLAQRSVRQHIFAENGGEEGLQLRWQRALSLIAICNGAISFINRCEYGSQPWRKIDALVWIALLDWQNERPSWELVAVDVQIFRFLVDPAISTETATSVDWYRSRAIVSDSTRTWWPVRFAIAMNIDGRTTMSALKC